MRRLLPVLLTFAVLSAGCGSTADPAEPAAAQPGDKWERLADPPLTPRNGAIGVWTGDAVILIGGDEWSCPPNASCAVPEFPPLADGAAYDPESDTWRSIADAPVPFAWAETAVIGDTAYFWLPATGRVGTRPAFLSYTPATDTWAELAWPQAQSADSGWYRLVAAGDRLVAWAGSDEQGERPDWIFDPATTTWERLPDDPLSDAYDRELVWSGDRLVLFDHEHVPNPNSERPSPTRVATLDLASGSWEQLPEGEILAAGPWFADGTRLINPTLGSADGGEVNGWGRAYPNGGVFDLATREWSGLPDPPAEEYGVAAGVVGHDGARFFGYRGHVLDASSGAWRSVPTLDELMAVDGRTVVTAGSDLVVFGGTDWTEGGSGELRNDAWIWKTGR